MKSELITDHHHLLQFIRLHENGRLERLNNDGIVTASLDPMNNVVSKDVVYSPEHNLSVRLFLPHKPKELTTTDNKLPLLIYFHGRAYINGSLFSLVYHNYLTEIVKTVNCLAVSAQYVERQSILFQLLTMIPGPRFSGSLLIPMDLEDLMIGSTITTISTEFFSLEIAQEKLNPRIKGIVMMHPGFWEKNQIDEHDVHDEGIRNRIAYIWEKIASPNSVDGVNDPWLNVVGSGSDIPGLGCEKVLVAVAGDDVFWWQGLAYVAKLKKSGWRGEVEVEVEVVEDEEEGHCLHLHNLILSML